MSRFLLLLVGECNDRKGFREQSRLLVPVMKWQLSGRAVESNVPANVYILNPCWLEYFTGIYVSGWFLWIGSVIERQTDSKHVSQRLKVVLKETHCAHIQFSLLLIVVRLFIICPLLQLLFSASV